MKSHTTQACQSTGADSLRATVRLKRIGLEMACDICGRGSCTESFHSLEEQERYEKVIAAFEKARELRAQVRAELEAEEAEEAQDDNA